MVSKEAEAWTGQTGAAYTDRNTLSSRELDDLYLQDWGITRTELNWQFLGELSRDTSILEVGCNIGMQLRHIQEMGFRNLQGIEIQQYAIDRSCVVAHTEQGSATALPYDDRSFDMVFTSGLLIHLAIPDLRKALGELYRCTKRYIWGFEHYSRDWMPLDAPSLKGLHWSGDYPRMLIDIFSDLRPALQKWMVCRDPAPPIVGHMYLLERIE